MTLSNISRMIVNQYQGTQQNQQSNSPGTSQSDPQVASNDQGNGFVKLMKKTFGGLLKSQTTGSQQTVPNDKGANVPNRPGLSVGNQQASNQSSITMTTSQDWGKTVGKFFSGMRQSNPSVSKATSLLKKYEQAMKGNDLPEAKRALKDLEFHLKGCKSQVTRFPSGARNLLNTTKSVLESSRFSNVQTAPPQKNINEKDIKKGSSFNNNLRHDSNIKTAMTTHHKADGDKYMTLGMQVNNGLGKDTNSAEQGTMQVNQHIAENELTPHGDPKIGGLLYLTSRERAQFKVEVQGGLLMQNGQPMNTKGNNLFVMDGKGNIYSADKNQVGHHSAMLAGNPAAAAGFIEVKNGVLKYVTSSSGHYQPTKDYMLQFKKEMQSKGVDFTNVDETFGVTSKQFQANARKGGYDNYTNTRVYPGIGLVDQSW